MVDVTDANFETEVLAVSDRVPVVVDLWAEWCGPCRTLGPILEKVIGETRGRVVLAKVDVDANPMIARAFQAQSIPAVHALVGRRPVDSFLGAQSEAFVREFVTRLLPPEVGAEVERLIGLGDEESLRSAVDLEPGHEGAVLALAKLLASTGRGEEATGLLSTVPESLESRHVAALVDAGDGVPRDIPARLDSLLGQVATDEGARAEFLKLLELLGPSDPRTPSYRRELASRLF